MCGIYGFNGIKDCFLILRNGAFQLHHRGQKFSGISTAEAGEIFHDVKQKFIKESFPKEYQDRFKGKMGIAHVSAKEEQPILMEDKFAVAFSGKFVNQEELKERYGVLSSSKSPATEILARIILKVIKEGKDFVEAIKRINEEVKGGWIIEILVPGKGVYVARDPYGFRPGILGRSIDGCAVSSESVAFKKTGMEIVRDLKPGEIVLLEKDGFRIFERDQLEQITPLGRHTFCLFEWIYNARASSILEGASVRTAQLNMGVKQAEQDNVEADIVIGIPLSGIIHALGYSRKSGIPFGWAYDFNRYSDRSYYGEEQEMRDEIAEDKMTELKEEIAGKRVIVMDDSLVRATQIRRLIFRMLDLGAKEVHLRTGAPPLVAPCPYYISTRTFGELPAANHSSEEIRKMIGARTYKPNTIENCIEAVLEAQSPERKVKNPLNPEDFCTACFTGNYPVK